MKGCVMQKILFTTLLLSIAPIQCTTLTVTVAYEDIMVNESHKIIIHKSWLLNETNQVSHSHGPYTCTWKVSDTGQNTFAVDCLLCENKNGKSSEITHPCLIVKKNQEGTVKMGEKTPSSSKSLQITAIVSE